MLKKLKYSSLQRVLLWMPFIVLLSLPGVRSAMKSLPDWKFPFQKK